MAEHLEGLMGTSMEKIRELVDVDTIVGKPIVTADGTTIVPISKVSFGFVSGGSDIAAKTSPQQLFAGGAGAGITIKPEAFIIISRDGGVKLLEIGVRDTAVESLIESVPELVARIKGLFAKKNDAESEPDVSGVSDDTDFSDD
ncbi:sporulation protein YtfJ [Clostridia bacterium]|nr:sporulation protein YtfJ [Clostridia bacterium]